MAASRHSLTSACALVMHTGWLTLAGCARRIEKVTPITKLATRTSGVAPVGLSEIGRAQHQEKRITESIEVAASSAQVKYSNEAWRTAAQEQVGIDACRQSTLCFVSVNRAMDHDSSFQAFADSCFNATGTPKTTDIIAFALQDHSRSSAPKTISDIKMEASKDSLGAFKIGQKIMLAESEVGEGHLCHGKFASAVLPGSVLGLATGLLLAHKGSSTGVSGVAGIVAGVMGTALGAGLGHLISSVAGLTCGSVAIVTYAKTDADITWDEKDDAVLKKRSSVTATTVKGSVAARFDINGRQVILASTHATEGIRGKYRSHNCDASSTWTGSEEGIRSEQQRVEDFREGISIIKQLQKVPTGVLWGGDYNSRSADPETGCAIFAATEVNNDDDAEQELRKLEGGRSILGSEKDDFTKIVKFSDVQQDLIEATENLKCPTYKKDQPERGGNKLFRCKEKGSPWMHYMSSHPPSWADRIFHSGEDISWLRCSPASRVPMKEDHDAMLVVCDIDSPECTTSNIDRSAAIASTTIRESQPDVSLTSFLGTQR